MNKLVITADTCSGSIPEGVEELILYGDFTYSDASPEKKYIAPGIIPLTVKKIILNCSLGILVPGSIPESVEELVISGIFVHNKPFTSIKFYIAPGIIPSTVKKLMLSCSANILVPGSIPNGIQEIKLRFCDVVNLKPGIIPITTKVIEFSENSINYVIPYGLIPENVECIKLGSNFKNSLSGLLPEKLKSLHISCPDYFYINELESVVPSTVLDFKLAIRPYTIGIPSNVTELFIIESEESINKTKPIFNFTISENVKNIYIPSNICIDDIMRLFELCGKKTSIIIMNDMIPIDFLRHFIFSYYDNTETKKVISKMNPNYNKSIKSYYKIVKQTMHDYKILFNENQICDVRHQEELRIENDKLRIENDKLRIKNHTLFTHNNAIKNKFIHLTDLLSEIL